MRGIGPAEVMQGGRICLRACKYSSFHLIKLPLPSSLEPIQPAPFLVDAQRYMLRSHMIHLRCIYGWLYTHMHGMPLPLSPS